MNTGICSSIRRKLQKHRETPATTKTEEPQAESEPAEPSEPEPEPLSYPTEPPLAVDFESLKAINPDVKGWLYIEALDISYPVVQGPDNDAYLHTTYEGTRQLCGVPFSSITRIRMISVMETQSFTVII